MAIRFPSSQPPGLQLVATLGPASLELAGALAQAGATGFRLNASHLTPPELARLATSLRAALPDAPLVIDLQGAKLRLGQFEPVAVRAGERVRFTVGASQSTAAFPIPHPEFFRATKAGDVLGGDDGKLRFRVLNKDKESLEAEALADGVLRPRKGINLIDHPVELEELTDADRAHCAALSGLGDAVFAYSFMKDGSEARWLRRVSPGCQVIGKVERREAIANLPALAEQVDALWICRGDLGEQLGAGDLARFVASLEVRALGRPVLMAGQVLEHLTRHATPTRSEICHLHDLVARGYAGIVLSDETAIGADPVHAVRTASALLREFAG